jgi:hypothetical protein
VAGNADTIRSGYEAFSRGDAEGMKAIWTDDFTWEGSNSEDLPGGGTHQGHDAVLQMLGAIQEPWESFSVTPDEFHESGETVIVLGHAEGRARETGQDGKWPFVHVWRLQGGKANRVLALADTHYIAKVLGVG